MNKKKKQNIVVISLAILVVLAAALVTAIFSTGLLDGRNGEGGAYKNTTFTDATLSCEQELSDEFGRRLSQKVLDSHSSRFEHQAGVYKIFLKAFTKINNKTTEYYVSCFVRASNGRISTFEIVEAAEAPKTEAIKRGSDKFIEWPK